MIRQRSIGWLAAGLLLGAAGAAQAKEVAEPALGVPFQPRHGVFVESHIGVFTAFMGSRAASNAQPYLGLTVGYDLSPTLSLFFSASHGANAASCRDFWKEGQPGTAGIDYDPDSGCRYYTETSGADRVKTGSSPKDFSVMPVELGVRYAFKGWADLRLSAYGAAVAGYTLLSPQVTKDAGPGSPHAGLGAGVEYVTRLEGLSLGAEVVIRAAFSPLMPSLTAYPRVRYVF